jgi:hypothetical protein
MEKQKDYLTSNFVDIEKYIEKNVEKKINQLFDVLPQDVSVKTPKMIYDYTVYELYSGTIQTIIDIINDTTELYSEKSYIDNKTYRKNLFNIFFKDDRKIFVGITLVIFSFILYFIDGAEA